jgi:hypothetical protein
MVPNLRALNLNYNFLTEVSPLDGLTRLRKLTIIGSRLAGTKTLIKILQKMPEMELVDFRMNPCTLGWYLPLLVKDPSSALQPSDDRRREDDTEDWGMLEDKPQPTHTKSKSTATQLSSSAPLSSTTKPQGVSAHSAWQDMDAKFRRDLPDESYIGRLVYRGLVMRACRRLKMMDGIEITNGEMEKAEKLLRGIQGATGIGNARAAASAATSGSHSRSQSLQHSTRSMQLQSSRPKLRPGDENPTSGGDTTDTTM